MEIPFRAVVGDILYGEHRRFKEGLEDRRIPYVLALKPSHAWWHRVDEVGWVEGVARASHWGGPENPGEGSNSNAASGMVTRKCGGHWRPSAPLMVPKSCVG